MPTIGEDLGHGQGSITWDLHPSVVGCNGVGIEVELEGIGNLNPPTPSGWRLVPDGSLRNGGVEYVFDGPTGGAEFYNRMMRFGESVEGLSSPPLCSERTSVHVHIDVRHLEYPQVWNMMVLYTIVEPYLFTLCGDSREHNIYSLSYEKGQGQISSLARMRTLQQLLRLGVEHRPKYSAMNINALLDFGSLEFRGMEGTYDVPRIINWTNHLLSLYEYAKQYRGSVEDLPALMSRLQPRGFLREIFGDLTSDVIEADVRERVYRGAWVAEDVLFGGRLEGIREELTESEGGYDLLEAFGVSQQAEPTSIATNYSGSGARFMRSTVGQYAQPAPAPGGRMYSYMTTTEREEIPPAPPPPQSEARVRLSGAARDYMNSHHPRIRVNPADSSIGYRQAVRVLQAAFGDDTNINVGPHGIGRLGEIFSETLETSGG
jgi:hypothetical protein